MTGATATKTYDTMTAARRRREKPEVSEQNIIDEIDRRTRDTSDELEKDGKYQTRRIESFRDFYDRCGLLPSMELPGFGERGEDCGTPLPHFCPEGHTNKIDRTCNSSMCERCASSWVRRRSVAKVDQLMSLLKIQLSRKPWLAVHFHHVVISPPDGWEADEENPLEAGYDVVREIMREMEMEGIAVYHPYRGRNGDDLGEWADRLFSQRDWEGDVRGELEHSPHWHVITATSWVPGNETTKRIQEETGWLVNRIANEETGRSIDSDEGMVKAVTYCISHAGIYEDSNEDMQGAVREIGATINHEIKVGENHDWAQAKTKEIAWQTLGIPSADLTCEASVEERAQMDVSGRSVTAGSTRVSAPGELDDADSGVSPDAAGVEDVEADVPSGGGSQSSTRTKCNQDLTKIHGAPHKLADETWVRRASAPGELLETYEQWVDHEDLLPEIAEKVGYTGHEEWIKELRQPG